MLRPGVPVVLIFTVLFGWQLRCLVLSASQFQHIWNDPGRTSQAYLGHAGHELSLLSGKRRGMIMQELCKKELAVLHPHSTITEPSQGACCNGARRSANNALYKLPWPGFRDRAPFDELYLTLFSPDSLYIIKHDLQTGVSAAGKRTGISGHDIEVTGASGQECWQTARSQMLDKFLAPGRCELVAQIDLSGVEVRNWQRNQMEGMTSRQDDAYQGIPLKHMTPRSRGLCIEEIAFELDQTSLQRSLSQRNSSVSSAFGHRCGSASFACHSEQQSSPHRPKALGFYLPREA